MGRRVVEKLQDRNCILQGGHQAGRLFYDAFACLRCKQPVSAVMVKFRSGRAFGNVVAGRAHGNQFYSAERVLLIE